MAQADPEPPNPVEFANQLATIANFSTMNAVDLSVVYHGLCLQKEAIFAVLNQPRCSHRPENFFNAQREIVRRLIDKVVRAMDEVRDGDVSDILEVIVDHEFQCGEAPDRIAGLILAKTTAANLQTGRAS